MLWNNIELNHETKINELFYKAKHFEIAVAFAKSSGFKLIKKEISKHLSRNMTGRMFVGLDFCHTEPEVLQELLILQDQFNETFSVYVSKDHNSSCFHPKIYYYEYADQKPILVVGSANLTRGGLVENRECSLVLVKQNENEVVSELNDLIKRKFVVKLDKNKLDKYGKKFNFLKITIKGIKNSIDDILENDEPGIVYFEDLIKRLKKDTSDSGFKAMANERKLAAERAMRLIGKLVIKRTITHDDLAKLRGCFNSGRLEWHFNKIGTNLDKFHDILKAAHGDQAKTVSVAWKSTSKIAVDTSGVGPNWVSEILHALNPKKYAILNRNSVAGMLMLNKNFPQSPDFNNIPSAVYRIFCADAAAIAKRLGLKNLSELDMIFNESYWSHR